MQINFTLYPLPRVPSKSDGLRNTPHPHVLLVVGVRGLFANGVFIALEMSRISDFDGALARSPTHFGAHKETAPG
jgi:hypothetical protein